MPPVIGFAGYSGSGKTTLIERLIPLLTARGLRLGVIKQTHHDFTIDRPGKDSDRHRAAGASRVLVSSPHRWALVDELGGRPEPALAEHLARFADCDLVLVEGYKLADMAKIEVHRHAAGQPLLYPHDARIVAVASDVALDTTLPCFALDDVAGLADFILCHTGLGRN